MPLNIQELKNKTKGTTATMIIEDNKTNVNDSVNDDVNVSVNVDKNVNVNVDRNVNVNVSMDVIDSIGQKSNFEKNFTRQTYYIHNDILNELAKLVRRSPKGTKTRIINEALRDYIKAKNSKME
jgi:hypothetical protein